MLPHDPSRFTAKMLKPLDYRKCACGRTISPMGPNKCDECQKTQKYFGTSDASQPHDRGQEYIKGNG